MANIKKSNEEIKVLIIIPGYFFFTHYKLALDCLMVSVEAKEVIVLKGLVKKGLVVSTIT